MPIKAVFLREQLLHMRHIALEEKFGCFNTLGGGEMKLAKYKACICEALQNPQLLIFLWIITF